MEGGANLIAAFEVATRRSTFATAALSADFAALVGLLISTAPFAALAAVLRSGRLLPAATGTTLCFNRLTLFVCRHKFRSTLKLR